MNEPLTKMMRVEKIEVKTWPDNVQYIIRSGKDKFLFSEYRKGTKETTKAFTQYKELGVQVGGQYVVAYSPYPKSFVKDGQTVNYTDNYISYFVNDEVKARQAISNEIPVVGELPTINLDEETMVHEMTKNVEQMNWGIISSRLNSIEARVKLLEDFNNVNPDTDVPF